MSICELCDDEKATIECAVCDQQLCASCDAGERGNSERESGLPRKHNDHRVLSLIAVRVSLYPGCLGLQICTSP